MDPLRAGHVAILGGRFHYYCNAQCKGAHLRAVAAAAAALSPDEVATLEPPAVAVALASVAPREGAAHSTVRPKVPDFRPAMPTLPAPADPLEPSATPPKASVPAPAAASPAPPVAAAQPSIPGPPPVPSFPPPPETESPRTLRSTDSSPGPQPAGIASRALAEAVKVAPSARAPRVTAESRRLERTLDAVSVAGILMGCLGPALGLLGPSLAIARLPLVGAAAAALVVRVLMTRRDPSEPHPFVTLVPVVVGAGAAAWARIGHHPRAAELTAFAGVAAAAVLAIDLMVARARTRVEALRARIARELDVRVRVLRGDEPVSLYSDEVRSGETVLVEAGEVVGIDGVVSGGEAVVVPFLDAAVEVTKREGDAVVAGARVVSGKLRLTTTWAGHERAWAKLTLSPSLRVDVAAPLARVTKLAVERGTPVAALLVAVAAFANGVTIVEIVAAACAAAVASGAKGVGAVVALHHARAHLVALGAGVVYRDARAFERAGQTDVAVFCARGTLLMGEPELVAVEALGAHEVTRVLSLAAGAETASTHPFAAAVLRAARTRGVRADNVRNPTVHPGLGVTALASTGERLVVGGRGLMLEEKVSVALADARVMELEAQGRSVLLVALGDKLVGILALQDGLRPGARAAVQRLLDARIEPVLLSGEARETCETIGRSLDIDHVRPEVLPSDRGSEVRALAEGGHVVAVMGHAAGDDAALGAADTALALGAAGATPGEWGITLASDDVRDAALALTEPRATRERVRSTLAFGLAPGVIALVAVAFGILPLVAAPLAAVVGAAAAVVRARDS